MICNFERLQNVASVNGVWLEWGEWSPCLGSCREASRSRGRACTAPAFNGRPCLGEHLETEQCDMNCPGGCFFPSGKCSYKNYGIILEWTEWAPWSSCSHSCDGGSRSRERNCTSHNSAPPPLAAASGPLVDNLGNSPSNFQFSKSCQQLVMESASSWNPVGKNHAQVKLWLINHNQLFTFSSLTFSSYGQHSHWL